MDAMNKGVKGWGNMFVDSDLKAPAQISDSESEDEYNTSKTETPIENLETQPILYNARALERNDETYKLETFEKNYLMIFNQVNLDGYSSPRFGTHKDVDALKKTFSPIGFEIHEHTDLTKDQIMDELKVLKEKDFTEYGCVAVAVLTHGTHGGLLRAKDMQYSETEIIKHFKIFKNPSLVTKPKILIIQACRGTKSIRGVEAQGPMSIHKDLDEEDESYTLPLESDILVLHSSYAGNPSHRVNLHGSWFIQILCEEIMKKSPAIDLEAIITDVKRKVAIDMCHEVYNKRTKQTDINKQMPVIMSTLIRKLYLKPFEDVTCVDNDVVENDAAVEEPVPITPLLVRFGPCSCFLDHFMYLKRCLRYIVNEHPEDRIAQNYLELCETFDDGDQFNSAKEKMAKLISEHLRCTAQDFEFYKYLYIYESRI